MALKNNLEDDVIKELSEVAEISFTPEHEEQLSDSFVIRGDTLKKLGLSNEDLEKLIRAKVARPHKFLTCGDYNL